MAGGAMNEFRRLRKAPTPQIRDVYMCPPHEGDTGEGVILDTEAGNINAILHQGVEADERAVLWVWGARGGYAGPAEGIFANLSEEFTAQGITSLRLNYRYPSAYGDSVLDALVGLDYLSSKGHSRITLVGHSFGGAVVIAAATLSDQAVAVVSLSPQTYGAQGAIYVSPRPLLIVHGLEDTRLPPFCARQIYQWAQDPKEIVLYPGTEHGLRECKDELHDLLRRWIPDKLQSRREGTKED